MIEVFFNAGTDTKNSENEKCHILAIKIMIWGWEKTILTCLKKNFFGHKIQMKVHFEIKTASENFQHRGSPLNQPPNMADNEK